MNRPRVVGVSFLAQAWNGMDKVSEVRGLSYDAARHVASAATITGSVGRLMSEDAGVAWCEVFTPNGGYREGPFAQTVLLWEVKS